ncbi:MAG: hypothetical protein HYX24_04690 [Candidatus Aenigmarchaeota archaeon]|nr:hypothetical protein [Candidatus Aenigmarchaeota archaeon]
MVEKAAIELVVARLRSMPDNALIAAGMGFSPMGREEIIMHVMNAEKGDKIGIKIVEAHLSYLRSVVKG